MISVTLGLPTLAGPRVHAMGSNFCLKIVCAWLVGELGGVRRAGGRAVKSVWRTSWVAGGWRSSFRISASLAAGCGLGGGRTVPCGGRVGWRAAGARAGKRELVGRAANRETPRIEQAGHRVA